MALSLPQGIDYREITNIDDVPFERDPRESTKFGGAVDAVRPAKRFASSFHGESKYVQKTIKLDVSETEEEYYGSVKRLFHQEIKNIHHARHQHVIDITMAYFFQSEEEAYFAIIMPHADGDLKRFVNRMTGSDGIKKKLLSRWFGCLASVTEYIHGIGIRHRDIKPENILFKGDKVMLSDFGISKMGLGKTLSTTVPLFMRTATPKYAAPEVGDGSTRGRSADIFSLGAVFLEMLLAHSYPQEMLKLRRKISGEGGQSYSKRLASVRVYVNEVQNRAGNDGALWQQAILCLCGEMLEEDREKRPSAERVYSVISSLPQSDGFPGPCGCPRQENLSGAHRLIEACKRSDGLDEVKALLQNQNPNTIGAIHQAAAHGFESIVQAFIDKNIDINLADHSGQTGLHCAAGYGQEAVVDLLLRNGAKIDLQDDEGQTPVHYAAGQGRLKVLNMLLLQDTRSTSVAVENNYGQTALHCAARRGNAEVVKILLQGMIPVDVAKPDGRKRTALHFAAGYGSKEVVRMLLRVLVPASVNEQDDNGWTPLHFASRGKHADGKYPEVVQSLLSKGADRRICDFQGNSPYFYAISNGQYGRLLRLLQPGSDDSASESVSSSESKQNESIAETGSSHTYVEFSEQGPTMLAERILNDIDLKETFQEALQGYGTDKFLRKHNRLLKDFLEELSRKDCDKENVKKAAEFLRRKRQRSLLTTAIWNTCSQQPGYTEGPLSQLTKTKPDRRNRLEAMLSDTSSATGSLNMSQSPERMENAANGSDSGSESGEDEDDKYEEDQRLEEEDLPSIRSLVDALTSGDPFKRYKDGLFQYLNSPRILAKALETGNIRRARHVLEKGFQHVRSGFPQLANLEKAGLSPIEIAHKIFECGAESSTIDFEASKSFLEDKALDPDLPKMTIPNLELQILSNPLRGIVSSIEKDRIWFTTPKEQDDNTWPNRLKTLVEDYTDAKWIWWPLSPRMKKLEKGQQRLNWLCHCGSHLWEEVSDEEATVIRSLLNKRVSIPTRSTFCQREDTRRSLDASLYTVSFGSTKPSQSPAGMAAPAPTYQSESHRQQMPPRSSAQNSQQSPTSMNQQGGAPSADTVDQGTIQPPIARERRWIWFGLPENYFDLPTVQLRQIQVYKNQQRCDWNFYKTLRYNYRDHRGPFLLWFSPWQLWSCDFVKFKIASEKEFFHESDVFHPSYTVPPENEYDYTPMPPNSNPPISPNEFAHRLSACDGTCKWKIFHKCFTPRDGSSNVRAIPKKMEYVRMNALREDMKAWGIEAIYGLSFIRIFVYHVAIVFGPSIFWGIWQRYHPEDFSNSSVVFTATLGVLSCYWGAVGALKSGKRK